MASVTVGLVVPLTQNVDEGPKLNVATGAAVMTTVEVAVAAAQPPAAAMVLVTVYVPGVDEASVMAPVVALMLRPVVEVNVPALAPVPNTTVGVAVPLTQKVEVVP
jgi:hypothetical protein